jgi:hypothetical protein
MAVFEYTCIYLHVYTYMYLHVLTCTYGHNPEKISFFETFLSLYICLGPWIYYPIFKKPDFLRIVTISTCQYM